MITPSREIEFKFGLPGKQAFHQLTEHLNLPESVLTGSVTQRNHFFDSHSLCLHKKHFVIRLREQKDMNILTIKGESAVKQDNNNILSNRVEEEIEIPAQVARDLLHGTTSPQQAIRDYFKHKSEYILQMIQAACRDQNLVHIGEFSNVRIHLPPVSLAVANTSETLNFELDTSTFPDGRVYYELEIEITEHTDAVAVEKSLVELLKQAGIEWHTAPSKAQRFFATLPDTN